MTTRILVVDNYDSFVYTIVGYLEQLGAECTVVRNDAVEASEAAAYDGVLVSPGPGTPEEAGVSMAIIRECARLDKPMFGVCLGHQALGVVAGESDVADLARQLRVGVVADALDEDAGGDALVDGLGPAGAEPGDAEDREGVAAGRPGGVLRAGGGGRRGYAGGGRHGSGGGGGGGGCGWRRGRLGAGEPALERVDGRRLGSVGGDPDDAELPDDEEQQDDSSGDGQLADDPDDRADCSHRPPQPPVTRSRSMVPVNAGKSPESLVATS